MTGLEEVTERKFSDYKDTEKTCVSCREGTYVDYPDGTIRCRNCGQEEVVRKTTGRKTDG